MRHIMSENKTQKEYLSHSDVFDTSSEYYSKMVEIVKSNNDYPKNIVKGRELHHIIPRSFSKKKHKDIDNRESNLVSLSYSDHFLIHFYAWKCALKDFRCSAARAVTIMKRSILSGDNIKNEFIANLIAESHDMLNNDANLRVLLYKGRTSKNRKTSFTMTALDGIMAQVLSNISRQTHIKDIYENLNVIGHTHSFQRYINNAIRCENKSDIDLATDTLTKIMRLIFKDTLNIWHRDNTVTFNIYRAMSFLIYYACIYHEDDYNENDTLQDVIDKYNNYIEFEQYVQYIESLDKFRDLTGKWYNDGFTEGRFKCNPDETCWKAGRLERMEALALKNSDKN